MPVVGDGLGGDGLPQEPHPPLVLLPADLGLPLEGGEGLGHEPGGGHGQAQAPVFVGGVLPPGVDGVAGDLGDAQHVLVGLRGQAQHEVELHGVPAAGEGGPQALGERLLGDIFVDGVPQPLGAGLGGEGEPRLPALLQPLHQLHGEVVRPQGGEGEVHVVLLAEGGQIVAQPHQLGVVAGGQGAEGHLLVAGVADGLPAVPGQHLPAPAAHRAVDVPRLAEPAAPDAPTEHLQGNPVVDDLRGGDDGFGGVVGAVHVVDHPFDHLLRRALPGGNGPDGAVGVVGYVVEGGDVDPLYAGGLPEEAGLVPALPLGPAEERRHLRQQLLPLADEGQVDKVRHGLGVVHSGAPGDDQGPEVRPVLAAQGQPGQIQHVQHSGIGHLVAHREADHIEGAHRVAGLQGEEGEAGGAHLLLHIGPGGEDPLAPHAGHVVEHPVEDAEAQVAHPDLIGVGEAEGEAEVHLVFVFHHRVVLAAGVAGGLLNAGQDAFQSLIHSVSPCRCVGPRRPNGTILTRFPFLGNRFFGIS